MSDRRPEFFVEKTDIMRKSHVFGLILSVFLFIGVVWFALDHTSSENSGKKIAEYLVDSAKVHDGVVDLSPFGSKVCIQPPGGLGKPMAMRQHAKPVVFEESIASEGIWSLSMERPDGVHVYAIPTSIVNWEPKGTEIYAELASCPKSLLIQVVNSVPTLIVE